MTDVTRMEAGRELDATIAEKIFGEVEANAPCGDGLTRTATIYASTMADCEKQIAHAYKKAIAGGLKMWPAQYIGPEYSSDIAAAWLIVEKMRADGWIFELTTCAVGEQSDLKPAARFQREFTDDETFRIADSDALSICLAALTALTVEVPR